MTRKLGAFLVLFFMLSTRAGAQCYTQMEGAAFGTVTAANNEAGACRVVALETQLASMTIRGAHPRLYITDDDIAALQAKSGQAAYTAVINGANSTTAQGMINSAMAYLLTGTGSYATNVYTYINNQTYSVDSAVACFTDGVTERKAVAFAALAFDWAYDGLTAEQRSAIQTKIETAYQFSNKKAEIDAGTIPKIGCSTYWRTGTRGETWHREEWFAYSFYVWPLVAFAEHNADAASIFKSIWGVNWFYGDQARAITYFQDGQPFEGYYYGAEGVDWFYILKSATGIDLLEHYKDSANYLLHKMDFGTKRIVLHRGVGNDTVGSTWYDSTAPSVSTWKLLEFLSRNFGLISATDPYANWVWNNEATQGAGSSYTSTGPRHTTWHMTNPYLTTTSELNNVSDLIFTDETWTSTNIKTATNSQKAFDFVTENGGQLISRSTWGDNATIFNFNADVQFTPNSHYDFSTNDISIYRRGNLSKSSGIYDATDGQFNYMQYQKTTNGHNALLIINPAYPNNPIKFSSTNYDPGGVEYVGSYRFSGSGSAFIRNNPLGSTKAEWANMNRYETHDDYAYACGDATTAYSSRASNYDRCVVFWRLANDEAYINDFARVTATSASYQKKMLYHTVTEPSVSGSVTSTEVTGHITNHDGSTWNSPNYQNNSKLYGKVLLPASATIRKVGGETVVSSGTATATISSTTVTGSGTTWLTDLPSLENGAHWFHMNADSDTHSPERWFRIATVDSDTQLTLMDTYTQATKSGGYTINRGYQWWMGSNPARNRMTSGAYRGVSSFNNTYRLAEDGNWRLEIIPPTSQATDYFLHTFYAADSASSAPSNNSLITSSAGGDMYGALVGDTVAMFGKTSTSITGTTFAVTNNATTKFLVTDLQTGYNYNVTKNGSALVSNQPASSMGTVYFSTNPGAGGSTFVVSQVGGALDIQTTSLADGVRNSAYDQSAIVTGGGTLTACDITVGSLPTGISVAVNGSNCRFSGTPTGSGTSSFTLRATDSLSNTDSQALSIIITPEVPFEITTTTIAAAVVGTAYASPAISTNGGTLPITFSISPGTSLPLWASINASTGVVSGVPDAAGTANYTVLAQDSASNSDTQAYTLVTNNTALNIVTTSLANGTVGVAYSQTFESEGGTGAITWSIDSAPPGISVGASTGVISGTPTSANTYIFTITATDANMITDSQLLSLTVDNPPPVPTVDESYSAGANVYGGSF